MSYFRICPNCGKGTIVRYATDNSLCGECSDNSSTTDKLSVEKLQEQLNSKVKALTEIRANIEEHNQIYDLSVDTALLLEGIDGIAFDALEAEEENE